MTRLILSALLPMMLALLSGTVFAGVSSVDHPERMAVGLTRPQQLSLDGEWRFQKDPDEVGESERWYQPGKVNEMTVRVPLPWQLADQELIPYRGTAWYEREVTIPSDYKGKRIALCFYGVDDSAKVWVNGQYVGEHTGAQAPFLLDISGAAKPGQKNVITVKVTDPPGGTSFFMDTHSLIGVSGIWRSVWIEATGESFISDVYMVPDIDHSRAIAQVTIYASNKTSNLKGVLAVQATGPDGKVYEASKSVRLKTGRTDPFMTVDLEVPMPQALLWDLDDPNLYQVDVSLTSRDEKPIDRVTTEFGMRKLHTANGRIYLNNKVIYIVGGGLDPGPFGGAVDVNWHEPPPYSDRTDEEIIKDLRKAKSLGVNFARAPLRPVHPRLPYCADRVGILLMQGGPWTPTKGIQAAGGMEEYKKSWSKIVLRDRNHPSVALWELFNESFGIGASEFKVLAGELYDHVKSLDPTRFILDNAGGAYLNELNYIDNHGKTDIEDVHSYPGFPTFAFAEGGEIRYPATTRELWLGVRWQDKPVLVTEFAPSPYVYDVSKIREKWRGEEPWWFNAKQLQSAMPAQWDLIGFEDRFNRWHFNEIYGNFTAYAQASDWYSFWALKFQTQLMRMNPELSGWVAWLFDGAPHPVGQIDYFKDIKVFGDELAKIWTQDLVLFDEQRKNYWEGENLYASLYVSHFSQEVLDDGRIDWWFEDTDQRGTISGISLEPGQVKRVEDIVFRIPGVDKSGMKRLHARLLSADGKTLSENYERIRVYPRSDRNPRTRSVGVHGLEGHRFEILGYQVHGFSKDAPVVLVNQLNFDDTAKNYVREGGTAVVFICEYPDYWERGTLPRILPIEKDLERNDLFLGRRFQGGHSDSFYARKGLGIFDRIPYDNPYIWSFKAVWPRRVIAGMKDEQWNDVLAGAHGNLFRSIPRDSMAKTSWEEVSGTLVQFKAGKGRLILSTFNLILPMLEDPAAAVILHDLITYANSDFEPGTNFELN
jgi:hypothetical protein